MKNNLLKFGIFAMFTLFYTLPALAQPSDSGGGFDDCDSCEQAAPIDSWMGILLLVGICLGAFFLSKQKSKLINSFK